MKFITSMTMVDQIIGSAPFVYEGDFAQGVAKARELGYDGVELHIADPADVDLPALEQALAENSMRLTAIGTGRAYVNHGLSITDPDEAHRRAACLLYTSQHLHTADGGAGLHTGHPDR